MPNNGLVIVAYLRNKIFANLERKNTSPKKDKNYFKLNFKKASKVGKFYLLPKMHKS